MRSFYATTLALVLVASPIFADEALIAVAANFSEVMERLEADFERDSPHELTVVVGSTGKIYAQIINGAPFDAFLSADQSRPSQLMEECQVVDEPFTYAVGRLTLWSSDADRIGPDGQQALNTGAFRALALANPQLAPYGNAARQVLRKLGLWKGLQSKVVMGENVGQAHAMVASGNAELGFVALSHVLSRSRGRGSRWDVPAELHWPIRQDAVLLSHGADNEAAKAFLDYLRGEQAQSLIQSFGYGSD